MGKPHFSRLARCIQQQTLELGAVLQALDLLDVLGGGKGLESMESMEG